MASRMSKPITRMTECWVRWKGRARKRLVITIYPNGAIEMRPERQKKRVETADLEAIYDRAVIARVTAERAAKKARKKKR